MGRCENRQPRLKIAPETPNREIGDIERTPDPESGDNKTPPAGRADELSGRQQDRCRYAAETILVDSRGTSLPR
jgi:hypothetical protein